MDPDSYGKPLDVARAAAGREVVTPQRSQPPELWRDEVVREVLRMGLKRDAALALFADRQKGHVTRAQALAADIGPGAFQGRIDRGYLCRVHRGVYRVGHTAPIEFDREVAAVLACGTRSVLSHASAAYLWALGPRPDGEVHVTGPDRRSRRGVRLHRSPVDPADVTRRQGVPVTRPARTLVDFAANAAPLLLEHAVEDALRRRLVTRHELGAELAGGRPGSGPLRRLLARDEGPALTRSEAERRFVALVRGAGLSAPEHNVLVQGMEVDLLWREHSLVVEVDGFAYHSGRVAFERDRTRDSRLVALGIRVMRVTWRQIVNEPSAVVAALAQALAVSPSEVRS